MATGILTYCRILSNWMGGQVGGGMYVYDKEVEKKTTSCVFCFGNYMGRLYGKSMGVKPRHIGLARADNNILI